MSTLFLAVVSVLAGVASALQAATNGALAGRIGLGATLVVSITVTSVAVAVFYFAQGGGRGSFFPAGTGWHFYLGGVYGFAIIAALAFAFPRLGGAWAIALLVLGQGMAAVAVDHFGWLDQAQTPISAARVAGLSLIVAGTFLLRWR
ncbi:MAG: DMT family transporter [Vicinamibacterales bacterium]